MTPRVHEPFDYARAAVVLVAALALAAALKVADLCRRLWRTPR
jgi:hypothetical protein